MTVALSQQLLALAKGQTAEGFVSVFFLKVKRSCSKAARQLGKNRG